MRALLSLMRGLARLVVVATAVIDVAMIWSMLLAFAGKPAVGGISPLLWRIGEPVLRLFSSISAPRELANGGSWSYMWLVGVLVVSAAGLVVAWAIRFLHEQLYGEFMLTQGVTPGELQDRAPNRMRREPGAEARDRGEVTPESQFGSGDRPPVPPSLQG